jgi:hypothetical protein
MQRYMSLKYTNPAKQESVTHINADTFWSTSKFQLVSGFITRYLEEILCDRHIILIKFFPSWRNSPPVGRDFPIIEASRSHSNTLHSVGLLWKSYQPDTENSFLAAHTTHKRQMYMYPARFEPIIPASERPQTHRLRPRGHMDRKYSKLLTIIPHPVLTFLYSISHSLATATH